MTLVPQDNNVMSDYNCSYWRRRIGRNCLHGLAAAQDCQEDAKWTTSMILNLEKDKKKEHDEWREKNRKERKEHDEWMEAMKAILAGGTH